MKSFVIIFVAGIMLLKPLWPVAEYISNYDYIKNVLCENKDRPMLNCDGKCYLSKLLAEENEQNQKNPFSEKQANSQMTLLVFMQVLPQLNLKNDLDQTQVKIATLVHNIIPTLLTEDLAQPPESV